MGFAWRSNKVKSLSLPLKVKMPDHVILLSYHT